MPELPDIELYLGCLERRIVECRLEGIRLRTPFLLRSVRPPLQQAHARRVIGLRRLGKRIVIELEGELFLVLHLMVAGRFQWKPAGAKIPGRLGLAAFDFESGCLLLTEAGTKRRASLHLVQGGSELAAFDRGGLEVLQATCERFGEVLRSESHTLKRALTDPGLFSGIGNAYSDEILHRAKLSPLKLTRRLGDEEVARLYDSTRCVLREWTDRLRKEIGDGFPTKVTAFRPGMSVHGRYGEACPVCGSPVQRIVYAENECNYCPGCQTSGRIFADRALSRLLHKDWPRNLQELEERRRRPSPPSQ